jgi:hypothetical protein
MAALLAGEGGGKGKNKRKIPAADHQRHLAKAKKKRADGGECGVSLSSSLCGCFYDEMLFRTMPLPSSHMCVHRRAVEPVGERRGKRGAWGGAHRPQDKPAGHRGAPAAGREQQEAQA